MFSFVRNIIQCIRDVRLERDIANVLKEIDDRKPKASIKQLLTLKELIARRSPQQIARMEKKRGLL